ncbi:MAG: hypothetical protein O3A46_04995 [Candidatus Poribacteria bacterium]|nr:hypothetical protein [Candidatus Poribacteria bacterium]
MRSTVPMNPTTITLTTSFNGAPSSNMMTLPTRTQGIRRGEWATEAMQRSRRTRKPMMPSISEISRRFDPLVLDSLE